MFNTDRNVEDVEVTFAQVEFLGLELTSSIEIPPYIIISLNAIVLPILDRINGLSSEPSPNVFALG